MPNKSGKQFRFMAMAANPKSRKKMKGKKPPMKVAKEYAKHGPPPKGKGLLER